MIPTHPRLQGALTGEQADRYAAVTGSLVGRGADPRISETGVMEVGGGFREAVFGRAGALRRMMEGLPEGAERQAFLDQQGPLNGYTKLIDAALRGRFSVVELLVDAGASTRLAGFNGLTALAAAERYNQQQAQLPEGQRQPLVPEQLLARLRAGSS